MRNSDDSFVYDNPELIGVTIVLGLIIFGVLFFNFSHLFFDDLKPMPPASVATHIAQLSSGDEELFGCMADAVEKKMAKTAEITSHFLEWTFEKCDYDLTRKRALSVFLRALDELKLKNE